MFGLGDNDEDERFWNLILFHVYATDDEIGDMLPAMAILLIVLCVVIVFLCWIL